MKEEGVTPAAASMGRDPPPPPRRGQNPRRYVIIGGGIAGVTAAEELLALGDQEEGTEQQAAPPVEVTMLTATRTVKQVGRVVKVTRKLEEVDVVERDADDFARGRRNLRILRTRVTGVDAGAHVVHCQGDALCDYTRSICSARGGLC